MNKQSFITILLTVLMSMTGAKSFAHDIEVANNDGVTIYYKWANNNTELAVSYRGSSYYSYSNEYTGNVVIPESVDYNGNSYPVTSIVEFAFYGCKGLTSVTIPNGVTFIGGQAFYYCTGLTSLTIPNGVTSIGEFAFIGCSGLTSVTIPNSVTYIGEYAFFECSELTSFTIPNSVTYIGRGAFSGCDNLATITVDAGNTVYNSPDGSNAIIETTSNTLVVGCKNTTIPNSVTSIGEYAFKNCSGLTSVTIPNSVTSIGECAFFWCYGLTSVTIPNSVTFIGESAFRACSELTSVTIPNSVTHIGSGAFGDCSNLATITVDAGNSIYNSPDGSNAIIETTSNTLVAGCKNTTIPNSVTFIDKHAFFGCDNLTSITIPNSVTSIGEYAFFGCDNLTSITIPNSVTSIGEYAFEGCFHLATIVSEIETPFIIGSIVSTSVTLVVPVGTKAAYQSTAGWDSFTKTVEVGEGGLVGSQIETGGICYTIGESNTASLTYANKVFSGEFAIPSPVELNGKKYDVTSVGENAFYDCGGLTSVTIPNSVTYIGEYAFLYCSELTSFTIPNSVTYIGRGVFSGCSNLANITVDAGNTVYNSPDGSNAIIETTSNTLVAGCKNTTIPNSVTYIGNYAFDGCSGLTSVNIPNSVTSIGECAFSYCI